MPAPPDLTSRVIERPGPQDRLLVLLHGYGEPVEALTSRLDLIDPEGRFLAVAPDAPFEHRGRSIWHRAMSAGAEAEDQFLASLAAIDTHLADLEARVGLPAADAVVGGFSQGGGLGIALLLWAGATHRPAAAFGVCSFAPHVAGFPVDLRAAAGRPCFLSSAHGDHFAPIEASRANAVALRDAGLLLTYVESEGGHEMTDAAATDVGAWLAAVHRGAPTATGHDLLAGTTPSDRLAELWTTAADAP